MVSVFPNPPADQDFSHFGGYYMAGDPMMKVPGMNRSNSNLLQTTPAANAALVVDDPNKKIRKPYTITKSRESWSEQEHDKFLEALQLFDRDWKKIEAFVGSKTVIQIRSHAQKYFLKVQKNGTSEHVPPPRPKRKAAHPYPQKAPKNVVTQAPGSVSIPRNPIPSAPLSSWKYNVTPAGCLANAPKDDTRLASMTNNYSSSSNESTPHVWKHNERHREVKAEQCNTTKVMPDFAQVYSFIGSVFDPTASDHLQRLRKMDPIDVETVVMLMNNLSVNLVSPEFDDHRRLLSSYSTTGSGHESMRSTIPSV